jgi:hypothetical protein
MCCPTAAHFLPEIFRLEVLGQLSVELFVPCTLWLWFSFWHLATGGTSLAKVGHCLDG